MIKLGERIKELRLRDGRTQDVLASELGVTAQAVSRWEKEICYPDMGMIPSIANYFGVSIDELFGYDNEREKKVNALAKKIQEMNHQNNGNDVCMEECISLAREALIEFPGNEKLTLDLASVLFNAGYVRHGEFHIVGDDGYSVYDTAKHKTYPEWQEAIKLYEKLLLSLPSGELRQKTIEELSQLYKNTGEHEKALRLAESAPELTASRPFLRIQAYDGKEAIDAMREALLATVQQSADLMVHIVLDDTTIPPIMAAERLQNAEGLFAQILPDHHYGKDFGLLACIQMLRSYYLWRAEKKEEAFLALDTALAYAKQLGQLEEKAFCAELPELWPWWDVPKRENVLTEMQADSRWTEWVEKTKE
ncbi:DNA-binding transcriptional regulator, XRE-family HTH domain [Lachnospiraceae bacterium XBB1006]|nr:DNA-binding transcriptional regulator, XRE-family HTH domain [Lachnospiraceae bacterium XBB1006]